MQKYLLPLTKTNKK